MAYLSWNTNKGFTDSIREAAALVNSGSGKLEKLAKEINSPIRWQDAAAQLEFRKDDELVPEAAPLYWAIVEATLGTFKDRHLPNTPFIPCPLAELRRLDVELGRQHVSLSVSDLALGPQRYSWIPRPEGTPLVSWWTPAQIEVAQDAVDRLVPPADPWLSEAISTIQEWIGRVRKTGAYPGYSGSRPCVVGFYY